MNFLNVQKYRKFIHKYRELIGGSLVSVMCVLLSWANSSPNGNLPAKREIYAKLPRLLVGVFFASNSANSKGDIYANANFSRVLSVLNLASSKGVLLLGRVVLQGDERIAKIAKHNFT